MVDQLAELRAADRSLFPGNFTIRALRDSRYHNTAYAIAELIDNSIEANAGQIDLLCMEQPQRVGTQIRQRVAEVAVLDKGEGMDVKTLFGALKFGGGTRHNSASGIGKYGMGLPTSSMSQCKRVDVWTWQDGLDSAWHSSIDADDIEQGNHHVPIPDQGTSIPEKWKSAGSDGIYGHRSGTLVVWSKLDKIQWKTGRTIIDNTSKEVGRMHRFFMKVFELGYPFLWKGRKSLACRRQAKRVSYRVQTTETQIDSGGIRWDSDGPVTQSMIASILWYGHRSTGNGFCEVTFDRMWASCFIG